MQGLETVQKDGRIQPWKEIWKENCNKEQMVERRNRKGGGRSKGKEIYGNDKVEDKFLEGEIMDKATEGKHFVRENRATCVL